MKGLQLIAAAVLAAGVQIVSAEGDAKYYACYSNHGSLKDSTSTAKFNSRGECRTVCVIDDRNDGGDGFSVQAMTKGEQCWCGNKLPSKAYKVANSKCNFPCPGFPEETCGNRAGDYFSVYITGLEPEPEEDPAPSSSSSSSASKTSSTSSSSLPTVTVAASPTAAEVQATTTPKKTKTTNKVPVIAGCIVGVLVIIGIGVGAWLFLRNRRRQQVEDEYRRSAAAREYNQKPASDHRLDPGMVQRRDSVGSIADNQDYSRRILKVTNPDG